MNDAAILGRLLREVTGTCRYCGCHAGTCRIGGGEVCSWAPSAPEQTICNAPGCLTRDMYQKQQDKREAERKAAAAVRAATVPSWVRARQNKRRRRQKAKARTAA